MPQKYRLKRWNCPTKIKQMFSFKRAFWDSLRNKFRKVSNNFQNQLKEDRNYKKLKKLLAFADKSSQIYTKLKKMKTTN